MGTNTTYCHENFVFTVSDVLSAAECQALIDETEAIGYDEAPITVEGGFVSRPDIRNNTRVILDDAAKARWLFDRLRSQLPARAYDWDLAGLNERFRFYRYTAGQKFNWHRDGSYMRNQNERSKLTLLLYLNGECTGGETRIDLPTGEVSIRPETGLACVFQHRLMHIGAEVTAGIKYVMRTDVMYRSPRR